MVEPLPGFVWNPKLARYQVLTGGYGQKPGTMVARKKVLGLLEVKVEESRQRLQSLTTDFQAGRLTAEEWQRAFAGQLKTLYLQSAALGAGGWDRLGFADFGRTGGYLKAEYRRLTGFAQAVIDGKLSEAQALARARMYAGKAAGMYWSTETAAMIKAGKTEERRVLGVAEHCDPCVDMANEGWQPIGHFEEPGTHADCWGHCQCGKEYR